jgi:predicted transcriptional regulator
MRTSRAEATGAGGHLERFGAPLTEIKDKLTDAVGEIREHVAGTRESAFNAIADKPLRWTLAAFAAGLVLGAVFGYRRPD